MFEFDASPQPLDDVRAWTEQDASLGRGLDDVGRIDLIRALEELTCAATAAQAVVSADLDASERADQAARGVPAARRGRGVAAQIALARLDVMSRSSALLPVKVGVAMHAVLTREADRLRAAGDPRSRGRLMADVLVDRVVSPAADITTTRRGPAAR